MIDLKKAVEKAVKKSSYENLEAVNQSRLKLLDPTTGGSPKLFLGSASGSVSRALPRGVAFHQYLLEEHKFMVPKYNRPSGMIGDLADKVLEQCINNSSPYIPDALITDIAKEINYGQSWNSTTLVQKVVDAKTREYVVERFDNPDMHLIMAEEMQKLKNGKLAWNNHSFCNWLRTNLTQTEMTLSWVDSETGIACKGRADMLFMDENKIILADPKSTEKNPRDPYFIKNYGVDFQLAFYLRGAKELYKQSYGKEFIGEAEAFTILVGMSDNPEVVVYRITNDKLKIQDEKITSLLKRLKYHQEKGFEYSMEEYENEDLYLDY